MLGSVGEPINPEAWLWYYKMIGKEECSIVDTFWQTETGGHVLTPLPGCTPMKPGAASFPFFGVKPVLLDEAGKVIEGPGEGYLVFNRPWPGIMRTLFGNHERFEQVYFSRFPGYYCTGDGASLQHTPFIATIPVCLGEYLNPRFCHRCAPRRGRLPVGDGPRGRHA